MRYPKQCLFASISEVFIVHKTNKRWDPEERQSCDDGE